MVRLYLIPVFVLFGINTYAQTNPAAQALNFSQNFSGLVATSTTYPAGFQGWTISTSPGGAYNTSTPTANQALIASGGASNSTGGVYNYDGKIGFLNNGSLDLGLVLAINTTSLTSISVGYDVMTIRNPYNGSTNTRINEVTLQYRIGTSGAFTNLTGIEYQNNTTLQTGVGVTTPQNSSSKSITLPSACENQSVVQLRWASKEVSGGGSRPSFAFDNIVITAAAPCTTPDAIAFVQQPTNVAQGATMTPNVTVKVYCTSSNATNLTYTGNITLTASAGACGYVAQTVAAVNGIATFNNIVFTRSVQSNITLTASASGFTNVVSNTFNITSPSGTITYTTLRNENYSGSTPTWSSTSSSEVVGSGGTGNDVTGVVTLSGNSYLRKSFSKDNASTEKGTQTTIEFSNNTGLGVYNSLTFSFKIASLNDVGTTVVCSGCGVDSPDSLKIETSVDNGATWQRLLTHLGASDKLFPLSASSVNLSLGANAIYSGTSTQSAFAVTIPLGTTQFKFRMIARNNRTGENWAIDDISLIGETVAGVVGAELPTVAATGNANICPGSSTTLGSSVSNAVGTITYAWSPTTGLDNSTISNPTATLSSTLTYTITITDADNCIGNSISSTAIITVDVPSTPFGDWLGTYSNDWFDCRNWKGKVLPSTTTDVVIKNTASTMPTIMQAGALCKNLTIESSSSLTINDPSSTLEVYGNYTNNNSLSHSNGLVTLKGAALQTVNAGSSSNSFYNLTINNSSGGITLSSNDLVISHIINLTNGIISTGSLKVILTDTNSTGLTHSSGSSSFINGNFRRYFVANTNTYKFPLGNGTSSTNYHPAEIINNNLTGMTYLDASINTITNSGNNIDTRLSTSQGLTPIIDIDETAEWNFVPNAEPSGGSYGVNLYVTNFSGLVDNQFCPMKRSSASTDYADWSTFSASTTIPAEGAAGRITNGGNGYAQRTGYTTFSKFAIGKGSSPLPIELMAFYGNYNDKKVELNWSTASEINNDYFTILKSQDGINFFELNRINGNGNSNFINSYQAFDPDPFVGINYYQLKQTDFDGMYSLSDVIAIEVIEASQLKIVKVNSNTEDISAVISSTPGEVIKVELIDITGKLLYSTIINGNEINKIVIPASNYRSGIYLLRIQDRNNTATKRVKL